MKNYLSFGGGVNSVALYLLLLEQGVEFEAVYVWMPDWPETHDYLMMMESRGYPVTVVMASKRKHEEGFNLYAHCLKYKIMPGFKRWCTMDYKVYTLQKYYQRPCFEMLGFATDEAHRAVLRCERDVERRYPLIENELSRDDCHKLITRHGLPQPIKSGCFFCPYQRKAQWQELRRKHPDLYCKALTLEKITGRNLPISNKPLESIVRESDSFLFDEMSYPPCECGL